MNPGGETVKVKEEGAVTADKRPASFRLVERTAGPSLFAGTNEFKADLEYATFLAPGRNLACWDCQELGFGHPPPRGPPQRETPTFERPPFP